MASPGWRPDHMHPPNTSISNPYKDVEDMAQAQRAYHMRLQQTALQYRPRIEIGMTLILDVDKPANWDGLDWMRQMKFKRSR